MTTDSTIKVRTCEHYPDSICLFDSCDPMCWTYLEHYGHRTTPAIQPPEGWTFDDFMGLAHVKTGQGIRYCWPRVTGQDGNATVRREANLQLLNMCLKWRMAKNNYECLHCRKSIRGHSTYASLHYWNAGISALTYPDRLHEACLDEWLEQQATRVQEHLEVVNEIGKGEGPE